MSQALHSTAEPFIATTTNTQPPQTLGVTYKLVLIIVMGTLPTNGPIDQTRGNILQNVQSRSVPPPPEKRVHDIYRDQGWVWLGD